MAGQGEWAEFNHLGGQKFRDFSAVKREIENETARIAGNNKGINRQPINLRIYSPHVLSLTLVDLPGLTKVPIGDQPTDIEKQTRTLISEYIAKPNSIILAVSPANVDIVNSEALKLARHVDPMGRRTIGVLTKIDLMDHGTNALDILSGRVYPLKLGFIGVVNRSQQDIQGNKPLADALKTEAEFFRHNPAYRNMASRCGTHFLAKTLNTTLMAHIRDRLPDIKARLNTLMGQTQQELASYGNNQFSGKEHRGSLILQLMTRFASSFISSIDGTSMEISTKELGGGARIYYIFNSVFGNSLETIDPIQNLSVLDIRTAIRNSTGPRPSLFVPELAFDLLVKPQIKLLEVPSQRCVELVYEELIKICHTCGSTELSRFPRLQAKLIEVVSDLLRERLGPASSYVESLISIQRAYINTNHPNFLGAAAAMSSVIQSKQEKDKKMAAAEERKKRERRRMKELVGSGINGTQTPEDDEEAAEDTRPLPIAGHMHKTGRSMSPTVSRAPENGHAHLGAHINGSPPIHATGAVAGSTRDSFLNYFFGKEGGLPSSNAAGGIGSGAAAGATRHVSHSTEPSFSQSIRRGDNRIVERAPLPQMSMHHNTYSNSLGQDDYSSRDYDYDSQLVSSPRPLPTSHQKEFFFFGACQAKLTTDFFPIQNSHPPPPTRSTAPNSRSAKPSRRNSSAASSPPTSTSSANPSPTRSPKPSCTSLSTIAKTSSRTGWSANCTGKICSAICCMRTMALKLRGISARSCWRRIGRRRRLWGRFCNFECTICTGVVFVVADFRLAGSTRGFGSSMFLSGECERCFVSFFEHCILGTFSSSTGIFLTHRQRRRCI